MKSCEFIRIDNPYEPEQEEIQCVWVQRPTSWPGGWARHCWLKKHFGKRALYIASPEGWEKLCKNNEVMILVEENGLYVEKKKDGGATTS
tara:strand:+ start:382 stop:651 length:270 start_codon:yes stop_codon:yes gene_type:complete